MTSYKHKKNGLCEITQFAGNFIRLLCYDKASTSYNNYFGSFFLILKCIGKIYICLLNSFQAVHSVSWVHMNESGLYWVMKPLIENRRQKSYSKKNNNIIKNKQKKSLAYIVDIGITVIPLFIKMPLYIPHLTEILSKRRFSTSTNRPNRIKVQPNGVQPKSK